METGEEVFNFYFEEIRYYFCTFMGNQPWKMIKTKAILLQSTLVVAFLFFSATLLVKAQAFLIPLTTAVILALLVLPLSQRMEQTFLTRATAALLNTLLLFIVSLGFLALISFQVKNIVDDWQKIRQSMQPKMEEFREFVFNHVPINEDKLQLDEKTISMAGKNMSADPSEKAGSFFNAFLSFVGDYLLTFIYIFFLLTYRRHFKEFLLRLFPKEKGDEVKKVIHRSSKVTQQYLIGKIVLIAILAALYAVGLGISGVDNFILISILASTLSLIPYIGNIIGFGIAIIFGFLTSGETGVLVGILVTFSVAQFVESYILEPYIVGDRVDLHPFFVILAVVLGNSLWGMMGMILSIPILAIINVVLLDIPSLHPFGFLLSNKPPSENLP